MNEILTDAQVFRIADAIAYRQQYFDDEPLNMSIKMVLFGWGDEYTEVSCLSGEWVGVKGDLASTSGVPKCPNGHVMVEGRQVRLGLVDIE